MRLGGCVAIVLCACNHAALAPSSASSPCVTQVVAGIGPDAGHLCALKADASLFCWGQNAYGQLGIGDLTTPVATPTRVTALVGRAVELAAGERHTCARTDDGRVWCWGADPAGQLGVDLGSTFDAQSDLPLRAAVTGAQHVAAGGWTSFAIDASGALSMWGSDPVLAPGANCNGVGCPPHVVELLSRDVAQVVGGELFACALRRDGSVACWGGNDPRGGDVLVPSPVDGLSDITQLSAGHKHLCALRSDGRVLCVGWNLFGQLGPDAPSDPQDPTPVEVPLGGRARQVSAGGAHSCALRDDGAVLCWGYDGAGQLGDGRATFDPVRAPVLVEAASPALAVLAGDLDSCAIRTDGRLVCWGTNYDGELALPPGDGSLTPVEIPLGCD